MKHILICLALIFLSGCAVIDGTRYVSGTIIGVKAGLPDGLDLVIGYQRYEIVTCETEANVDIGIEGQVNATGLDGNQHAKFGPLNQGEINVQESRNHDPETRRP